MSGSYAARSLLMSYKPTQTERLQVLEAMLKMKTFFRKHKLHTAGIIGAELGFFCLDNASNRRLFRSILQPWSASKIFGRIPMIIMMEQKSKLESWFSCNLANLEQQLLSSMLTTPILSSILAILV
jgi:hypothetical protein